MNKLYAVTFKIKGFVRDDSVYVLAENGAEALTIAVKNRTLSFDVVGVKYLCKEDEILKEDKE